ncbi:hypothetical protein GWI33_000141 [Rhynchophorus ferrugineus]|uniref:Uncharacterized protein n=1 Tax=Rhynchophorus ferrugineus TaxID=354439 RepID=A0A834MLE2_RHYFE|nr:hypothetical protein GWI33_000141 [Rhynchophorus ferrugineus]
MMLFGRFDDRFVNEREKTATRNGVNAGRKIVLFPCVRRGVQRPGKTPQAALLSELSRNRSGTAAVPPPTSARINSLFNPNSFCTRLWGKSATSNRPRK